MTDNQKSEPNPYEVFLAGETIDLVIPNEHAIDVDNWHSWFNDPQVTRYSDHGAFPNTKENQRRILASFAAPDSNLLALLIQPKGQSNVVGIVSLSSISTIHRSAETAVIVNNRTSGNGRIFYGLEAKARITEHAFETMGLERISGSQAKPLAAWQRYQVLFGFTPEGIKRKAFRRGYHTDDCIISSCTLSDYLRVKKARGGAYWPGREKLLELARALPKHSIADQVAEAIDNAVDDYLKDINYG